jgi:hypothetical protein
MFNYQRSYRKLPAQLFGREIGPKPKPKTLADKLREYRAALRAEGREPVDEFCRRGEISARFAYFD